VAQGNGVVGADLLRCETSLEQESIRVDVNLVNVFATVQDERGQFMTIVDHGWL